MIGLTVPWNASWSAEDDYEIRPCRWAGGKPAVWSPHRPGEGKPIFAKPHMVRQRRSIAEFRCTVCGEKTPTWDRWWFGLGNQIDGWAFATTEAPVQGARRNRHGVRDDLYRTGTNRDHGAGDRRIVTAPTQGAAMEIANA